MVTVGLVKELLFMSVALKTDVQVTLVTEIALPVSLKIHKNVLDVWYQNEHIWHEYIEGDTAFFGVESCDTISRIIAAMNVGDIGNAKTLWFHEDKLDKTSSLD